MCLKIFFLSKYDERKQVTIRLLTSPEHECAFSKFSAAKPNVSRDGPLDQQLVHANKNMENENGCYAQEAQSEESREEVIRTRGRQIAGFSLCLSITHVRRGSVRMVGDTRTYQK